MIQFEAPSTKNATLVDKSNMSQRALRKLSYSAVVEKQYDIDKSRSQRMNLSQYSMVSAEGLREESSPLNALK